VYLGGALGPVRPGGDASVPVPDPVPDPDPGTGTGTNNQREEITPWRAGSRPRLRALPFC